MELKLYNNRFAMPEKNIPQLQGLSSYFITYSSMAFWAHSNSMTQNDDKATGLSILAPQRNFTLMCLVKENTLSPFFFQLNKYPISMSDREASRNLFLKISLPRKLLEFYMSTLTGILN